LNYTRRSHAY